jgi:spermidine/putrescine transport system permease protein
MNQTGQSIKQKHRAQTQNTGLLLLVPFFLWIGVLFILPHLELLFLSFFRFRSGEPTLNNYTLFFTESLYRSTFIRTAIFAVFVTALTLLICFPAAYFVTKVLEQRLRNSILVLIIMPFWISELIRAFAWMTLLRETGAISYFLQVVHLTNHNVELLYNNGAITIGLVYASVLFMMVPLLTTLDTLDNSLIEAAYDLGASFWTTMREIVIPHSAPGIVSGCIVVFMLSLGNFVTVTLLGGKNSLWFTEQIYNQFILRFNWNQGSAFGFVFLLLSVLIVWIFLRLSRQNITKVLE